MRSRNWTFIFYPDDLPSDWLDKLQDVSDNDTGTSFIVSPLHDKDVRDDGKPKKRHYHILAISKTEKNLDQYKQLFSGLFGTQENSIKGVGKPIEEECRVKDHKGAIEYLVHKNHPQKAQYEVEDIITIGNTDVVEKMFKHARKQEIEVMVLDELVRIIDEKRLTNFYALCAITRKNAKLFRYIAHHPYFVKQLLNDRVALYSNEEVTDELAETVNANAEMWNEYEEREAKSCEQRGVPYVSKFAVDKVSLEINENEIPFDEEVAFSDYEMSLCDT